MSAYTGDYYSKLAKFLMNEIWPRERRYHCKTFPKTVALIFHDEYQKKTTRKQSREILDGIFRNSSA